MSMVIENVIFYILLLDAISAALLAIWGVGPWWAASLGRIGKELPLTRGWSLWYLMLVLFIGWILYRTNTLYIPAI